MGLFRKKTHSAQAAGEAKVYYSTPFGDTKDGGQKLFLLGRGEMKFFPVFRSRESRELMKDVAIVIEPLGANPVEIMPNS